MGRLHGNLHSIGLITETPVEKHDPARFDTPLTCFS
jgi:hypothetical protein